MNEKIFSQIIRVGIMAPSGDNLQPWKIKPSPDYNSFTLYHTVSEKDFFDVSFSASYIASGAFLENIKLAAENFGYKSIIKINKDPRSKEIAKISFIKNKIIKNSLFNFIKDRQTSRLTYNNKDLPESFYNELNEEIKNFSKVNLIIKKKDNLIENILYKADIIRFSTRGAHETLNNHIIYTKKDIEKGIGLDYRTLGIPLFPNLMLKILSSWNLIKVLKFFNLTKILAYISSKSLIKSSPGVGIITVEKDTKENLIVSGMLFEKVWLLITKYNATLQPFATLSFFIRRIKDLKGKGFSSKQVNELKKLNNELSLRIKNKNPISIIFRFGFSNKQKVRSLRKPYEDFIIN